MEGVRRRRGNGGGGGGGGGGGATGNGRQGDVMVVDERKNHLMDSDAFWTANVAGVSAGGGGGRRARGKAGSHSHNDDNDDGVHARATSNDREEFPLISVPAGPYGGYYGVIFWAASATFKWFYDMLPSWQSFSTMLWSAPTQPFVITPAMQQKVDEFKLKIGVAYSDEEPEHVAVLQQYWALCFPGEVYERKSKRWCDVGFQSDDPGRDFRGAGICGLRHLCHFAKELPVDFERCKQSGYPFSIAGLNISMMLYQLMGWGFKKREPLPELYRLVFSQQGGDAFNDLYCKALNILDDEWRKKNAQYMDFPVVLASTEIRVKAYIIAQSRALQN